MDHMTSNLETGFDVYRLEKLFPEDMYAYERWNKMHTSFEKRARTSTRAKRKPPTRATMKIRTTKTTTPLLKIKPTGEVISIPVSNSSTPGLEP